MTSILRPSTVVLSQQELSARITEVAAQNISNTSTSGYKAIAASGVESAKKAFHEKVSYVRPTPYRRILDDGPIKQTGVPLNVAIRGQGYFQVKTPEGNRLTRAGQFLMSPDKMLITSRGDFVLDSSGSPITLDDSEDVAIGIDGAMSTSKGPLGRTLAIVKVDNEQELSNVGYGLYNTTQTPIQMDNPVVIQGAIEESNVSPVNEIIKLMQNLRSFENAQKMIDTEDDRQRKVINISSK